MTTSKTVNLFLNLLNSWLDLKDKRKNQVLAFKKYKQLKKEFLK